jgi:hypothetical protein
MGGRILAWLGLAPLLASGCILDDDKCGANQVESSTKFEGCTCAANAVPNEDGVGCRMCPENQEAKNGACSCVAGFSRASPTAACMQVVDSGAPEGGTAEAGMSMSSGTRGLNMACKSSADCEGFDATYCVTLQAPNVCQIEGCVTKTHTCPADYECCDFSVGPLFAGTNGLCVPTTKCPAGLGKVVTP